MALFDFFKRFAFFKGRDTQGLQEEDLDFGKWVNAHRDWRRRLTEYIEGHSNEALDENVICLDNRCDLGKWIHGNGTRFYGNVDTFTELQRHHAQFHLCAGEVVRTHKTQGADMARRLVRTDFDRYSLMVISDLELLEKKVKG